MSEMTTARMSLRQFLFGRIARALVGRRPSLLGLFQELIVLLSSHNFPLTVPLSRVQPLEEDLLITHLQQPQAPQAQAHSLVETAL